MDDALLFERWIDRWRGPLVGLLAAWGAPWRDARELAQDTFAEAWFARERFVGDDEDLERAGAWLRGIAFRLHQTWLRRRGRLTALEAVEDEPALPEAEEDERLDRLRHAIDGLPSKERAVIWMHYLEETEVEHVAALLGTTPRAVEGRLYRARKLLRERLTADPSAPSDPPAVSVESADSTPGGER